MSEQMKTFLLSDLGEGLTSADIVNWLVEVGDTIEVDQAIAEVETAKSIIEVPSPYAGVVLTLHAEAGETLDVGKPLITVGVAEASNGTAEHSDGARYREEEQAGSGNVLVGYGTKTQGSTSRRRRPRRAAAAVEERVRTSVPKVISPVVRKLAREEGLDLHELTGTGSGGMITRSDVETAIASTSELVTTTVPSAGERRIPLSGFRKAVSEALTRSRREIPEATVWVDIDATELWNLRETARASGASVPSLTAYFARFAVAGLREFPVLNASVDTEREEIIEYDHINLGIAVQGDRGLVVPAIKNAERMSTRELDEAIRDIAERGRAGKISPEEMARGTFTLNNYGGFGVDGSAAIINHPQVAILGFGRIIDRPWVVDGEITARKIAQMSFVFDHRVCDGATASGFMRFVADAIENPASAIAQL